MIPERVIWPLEASVKFAKGTKWLGLMCFVLRLKNAPEKVLWRFFGLSVLGFNVVVCV